MPAIGIGMLWGAYTAALWGWTLIKGYQLTLGDIAMPGRKVTWPPPKLPDNVVFGGGAAPKTNAQGPTTPPPGFQNQAPGPPNSVIPGQPGVPPNGGTWGQVPPGVGLTAGGFGGAVNV